MKVGLVLGAGGVMGGAWLTGGLDALASETGWDPGSADYIVGTSAGSMMGSLVASGIPPVPATMNWHPGFGVQVAEAGLRSGTLNSFFPSVTGT